MIVRMCGRLLAAGVFVAAAVWMTVSTAGLVPLLDTDMFVYVSSVRAVHDGVPMYEFVAPSGFPFTYPPFAAATFWPLIWADASVLRIVWVIALCATALACAVALARRLELGWSMAFAGATLLIVSAPLHSNMKYVQVSAVLVLLSLLDGLGLVPERWRGVLTGVAGAIKLTPLLFVLYFLVTGQRAAALRAMAAFAGGTALAAVIFPSESWVFWTSAVFDPSRTGPVSYHLGIGDQSIQAVLMRLGLPYGSTGLTVLAGVLGVAVCLAALTAARWLHRSGKIVEAVLVVGCATLLASPVAWTHHQVWTVLAGLLLLTYPAWSARVAGVVILVVMTAHPKSIAAFLLHFPGAGVVVPNGRALCALALCVAALFAGRRLQRVSSVAEAPHRSPQRTSTASAAPGWPAPDR